MNMKAHVLLAIFVLFGLQACGVEDTPTENPPPTSDKTPPSVAITAPTNNTAHDPGVIVISGSASDNVSLASVGISIDSGTETNVSGLGSWSYSWDASSASAGNHTIVVTAHDTTNNTSQAQITISLNDTSTPGVINIVTSSMNVNEDVGSVTVIVERSGGTDGAISVDWRTVQHTATDPGDYQGDNNVFSWADGESGQRQVSIPIVDDTDEELSEYFNFQIDNLLGGATLGSDTSISITINANDSNGAIGGYVLPIGIPAPTFGINETHQMYAGKTYAAGGFVYKDAGNGPYTHFVDRTAPNCASTNAGGYGDATNPLCTIPTSGVQEGSVIEVHGQYDRAHSSPSNLQNYQGTATNPIFIRGVNAKITGYMEVIDSHYVIIENISFEDRDGDLSGGDTGKLKVTNKNSTRYDSDYIAIRNNEISGNINDGGLAIGGNAGSTFHNILILNNNIHNNGDWQANFDQDRHGIALGAGSNNVWVLDNNLSYNSGDGIQINGGTNGITDLHHIYVGGNIAHHNKQSGFWSKQASDVIFSQNIAHSHVASNSSDGQGMGFQYGPERIWFLYNEIYDSENGIIVGANSGGLGVDSYYIGNKIHSIHNDTQSYTGTPDLIQGTAIGIRGGVRRHIIGNTIYDVDGGISILSGNDTQIKNNILNNVISDIHLAANTYTHHLRIDDRSSGYQGIRNSSIDNNIFYQSNGSVKIIDGMDYVNGMSLADFQTLHTVCANCIEADPLFTNPSSNDFTLQSSSPAIDNGVLVDAYQTFYNLYGEDISVDFFGDSRPAGNGWDIGAFEHGSSN
jgi:hypothetical protein